MADITTVAARIAAVESKVAAFADTVRKERDELTAELKQHLDLHAAEVSTTKALLDKISPAAPAATQHVFIAPKVSLVRYWRHVVIGVSVLICLYYFIHEGHT